MIFDSESPPASPPPYGSGIDVEDDHFGAEEFRWSCDNKDLRKVNVNKQVRNGNLRDLINGVSFKNRPRKKLICSTLFLLSLNKTFVIVIFWCIRLTDYNRAFFATLSMNSSNLRDKISPRFGALLYMHTCHGWLPLQLVSWGKAQLLYYTKHCNELYNT